VTAEGFKI